MKIKKIRLERFRQFADTTFEVGDFNLLVGPNNCGKTSVLHAIRAFFLLMHGHVRFEGDPPSAKYHRRFLTGAEEVAPTPDIKELWFGLQAGKPLKISVTFEDDATFSVVLRQQFGQLHVSAEDLPKDLTAKKTAKYLGTQVAFIPGLVGVLVAEPYATRGSHGVNRALPVLSSSHSWGEGAGSVLYVGTCRMVLTRGSEGAFKCRS
jgi:energy-coupling factor transporter ATP-binding protein EcfA2